MGLETQIKDECPKCGLIFYRPRRALEATKSNVKLFCDRCRKEYAADNS